MKAGEIQQTGGASVARQVVNPANETPLPSTTHRHQWALLRDSTTNLQQQASDGHRSAQSTDIDERARSYATQAPAIVLETVAETSGVSWTDLAELLDVSVSAIRKWRAGVDPAPQKRAALARVAAFMELLDEAAVHNPAGWLQIPIRDGWTVTPADLYRAGCLLEVLDFAYRRVSANDTMTAFAQDWVEKYRATHAVTLGEDGRRALRALDR